MSRRKVRKTWRPRNERILSDNLARMEDVTCRGGELDGRLMKVDRDLDFAFFRTPKPNGSNVNRLTPGVHQIHAHGFHRYEWNGHLDENRRRIFIPSS